MFQFETSIPRFLHWFETFKPMQEPGDFTNFKSFLLVLGTSTRSRSRPKKISDHEPNTVAAGLNFFGSRPKKILYCFHQAVYHGKFSGKLITITGRDRNFFLDRDRDPVATHVVGRCSPTKFSRSSSNKNYFLKEF
jgi:hypothetical protein